MPFSYFIEMELKIIIKVTKETFKKMMKDGVIKLNSNLSNYGKSKRYRFIEEPVHERWIRNQK